MCTGKIFIENYKILTVLKHVSPGDNDILLVGADSRLAQIKLKQCVFYSAGGNVTNEPY